MNSESCKNYSSKSIRRGTTPNNTFHVNIDLRDATVFISYAQRERVLVEKTNDDIFITEDTLSVTLTQEDTLLFKPGEVEIQVRYVTRSGKADASNIIKTTADQVLKDGVIEYV